MPFDLQGFIDKELNAGSKRIVVPPGRYRVTPRDRQHLLLRGLNDDRKSLPGLMRKAGMKELKPVVEINCDP